MEGEGGPTETSKLKPLLPPKGIIFQCVYPDMKLGPMEKMVCMNMQRVNGARKVLQENKRKEEGAASAVVRNSEVLDSLLRDPKGQELFGDGACGLFKVLQEGAPDHDPGEGPFLPNVVARHARDHGRLALGRAARARRRARAEAAGGGKTKLPVRSQQMEDLIYGKDQSKAPNDEVKDEYQEYKSFLTTSRASLRRILANKAKLDQKAVQNQVEKCLQNNLENLEGSDSAKLQELVGSLENLQNTFKEDFNIIKEAIQTVMEIDEEEQATEQSLNFFADLTEENKEGEGGSGAPTGLDAAKQNLERARAEREQAKADIEELQKLGNTVQNKFKEVHEIYKIIREMFEHKRGKRLSLAGSINQAKIKKLRTSSSPEDAKTKEYLDSRQTKLKSSLEVLEALVKEEVWLKTDKFLSKTVPELTKKVNDSVQTHQDKLAKLENEVNLSEKLLKAKTLVAAST